MAHHNLVLVPRAVVARVRPPKGIAEGALDALLVDAHGLVRIGPARDDLRGPALVEVRVRVRIY